MSRGRRAACIDQGARGSWWTQGAPMGDDGQISNSGGALGLTVSEAAAYLGVSQSTLRRWADNGQVEAYRTPGGQRRFPPAGLERFLAGRRRREDPASLPRSVRGARYRQLPDKDSR